jgi:hypothetical protein
MFPSVNDWTYFMYTVADWLLPRSENPDLILKFQPVPKKPNDDWTDNFLECVRWFRQKTKKTIKGSNKDLER